MGAARRPGVSDRSGRWHGRRRRAGAPDGSAFTAGGTAIGWCVMPIRSPGNVRAGSIRDLGLPPRAVTALTGAGVTTVDDLAVLTRRDLVAINGLGPGLIAAIRRVVPEPPAGAPSSAVSSE